MQHPPITLRYFDARARAQFLRQYFRVRNVKYNDERVPLAADFAPWRAIRDDRSRTGPFHKLPVLQWGDRLIAETLMIAAFVHEVSGDAGALNDDDNLRHGMLTSSLSQDISSPISQLLWADSLYPGADLGAIVKRTLERTQSHIRALEQTLTEWRWIDKARNRRVMLADCLLWEVLNVAHTVFGPSFSVAELPLLTRFYNDFPGRPAGEELLAEKPCPITARPEEAAAIAKIQQLLG